MGREKDEADDILFDDIDKPEPRDNSDDFYGDSWGSTPMERNNDLLKDLTDFDAYIRDTVSGWLGLIWSIEHSKYIRDPTLIPMMNNSCANWCVTLLKTYARKNNIITYIRQDDYKDMQEDLIEVVWLNIPARKEEFGISNNGDAFRICTELFHASILALMGAGGGKYTDFMSGTMRHNTNEQVTPHANFDNRNTGVIKRFKNWLIG